MISTFQFMLTDSIGVSDVSFGLVAEDEGGGSKRGDREEEKVMILVIKKHAVKLGR